MEHGHTREAQCRADYAPRTLRPVPAACPAQAPRSAPAARRCAAPAPGWEPVGLWRRVVTEFDTCGASARLGACRFRDRVGTELVTACKKFNAKARQSAPLTSSATHKLGSKPCTDTPAGAAPRKARGRPPSSAPARVRDQSLSQRPAPPAQAPAGTGLDCDVVAQAMGGRHGAKHRASSCRRVQQTDYKPARGVTASTCDSRETWWEHRPAHKADRSDPTGLLEKADCRFTSWALCKPSS